MTDRADLLRRAGAGAAGFSLGQLLGPAAALAGDGGGDFPAHPRWRFVFVSHDTLDPLLIATQFGAQDAAALVRCTTQWTGSPSGSVKETVKALRTAISKKADGIAVSVLDAAAVAPAAEAAAKAGIPLVAFNVDSGSTGRRYAYVGENPGASGVRVGVEAARLAPTGTVILFAPRQSKSWTERRLKGICALLTEAGIEVTGHLGDPDPVVAVENAIHDEGFDEIIVSTFPEATSGWLRRDVVGRIKSFGLPVSHVVVTPQEAEAAEGAAV